MAELMTLITYLKTLFIPVLLVVFVILFSTKEENSHLMKITVLNIQIVKEL